MIRRLRIDLSDDEKERAENYAKEHGLRMPRAYGEMIQSGLDNLTESNDGN